MKKGLFILIVLLSFKSFGQQVVGFGAIGGNLDTSFKSSSFASLSAGVAYDVTNLIKPEIKAEYLIGVLPDTGFEYDANYMHTKFIERKIAAANYSVSPRINFGKKVATVHLELIPTYNYTVVFASVKEFRYDTTKNYYIKTDEDNVRQVERSVGLGAAIVLDINDTTFQAIAIELNYNNIELGSAFGRLRINTSSFKTNQSLGLRVKYYFGITKKIKIKKINQ